MNQLFEETQKYLTKILSEATDLSASEINPKEPLERYGIDSLIISSLNETIEARFGKLSKTLFFEYQTISDLARYFVDHHAEVLLKKKPSSQIIDEALKTYPGQRISTPETSQIGFQKRFIDLKPDTLVDGLNYDIAIIGLSGRYPMANSLKEYWNNLKQGRDCIVEIPTDRWRYDKRSGEPGSKWGGFIDDVDKFDPLFFNITPKEAELIDPQERLFLETVWHTIEDAGYSKSKLDGTNTGVFVGAMWSQYQLFGAEENNKKSQIAPISSFASIANRVSYFFNFNGPSLALDTMCSSSLTAIHFACECIKSKQCGLAIAGGVNTSIHENKYSVLSQGKFLSSDGRCRSFGVGGDGYVPGEGVGAVFLKPLAKAIVDNDNIYAVIKGSALNHGGKTNGYTVPNPNLQARLIGDAFNKSGFEPSTVSYIEAHGTGTSLGDPIEITGLKKAFGASDQEKQYCPIGSVKSNIGHLESAAGIAGITKTVLQMRFKQIVPSIHSSELNPNIDFESTPFYIQKELAPWKRPVKLTDGDKIFLPRRAGVSSFGAGGANAHIVLEEYVPSDTLAPKVETNTEATPSVFILSARTQERLKVHARQMLDFLRNGNLEQSGTTSNISIEDIHEKLAGLASSILGVDKHSFDTDSELREFGFDPIARHQFKKQIQKKYNFRIDQSYFLDQSSIGRIARKIYKDHNAVTAVSSKSFNAAHFQDLIYTLQEGREAMSERLAIVVTGLEDLIDKLTRFCQEENGITGLYTGNLKAIDTSIGLLISGKSGKAFLNAVVQQKEFSKIAELWANGINFDWNLLYPANHPKRISLPAYPFKKDRFWVPDAVVDKPNTMNSATRLHPLVGQNISTLEEQKFNTHFTGKEFYLRDHRVLGQKVLPGVAYIEMACAAGKLSNLKHIIRLENIVWMQPITVSDKPCDVQIILDPKPSHTEFRIIESGKTTPGNIYSQGKILHAQTPVNGRQKGVLNIEEIMTRCKTIKHHDECYAFFKKTGLEYRSTFQPIERIYCSDKEALSSLKLSQNIRDSFEQFVLHPSIMDGALQTVSGLTMSNEFKHSYYLPFSLERIEIEQPLTPTCYAYATIVDNHGKESPVKKFNITLLNEKGETLVRLRRLSVRELKRAPIEKLDKKDAVLVYKKNWKESVLQAGELADTLMGNILILHDDYQLFDSFDRQRDYRLISVKLSEGYNCIDKCNYEINPSNKADYHTLFSSLQSLGISPDRIVCCWALGSVSIKQNAIEEHLSKSAYAMLHLSQALMAEKTDKTRILYVYPESLTGTESIYSGLSGFAKTAQLENPKLAFRIIGVDENTVENRQLIKELIVNELRTGDFTGENIRYQSGKRMISEFARQRDDETIAQNPIMLKEFGVYLITGGMGGLGLIFAKYLLNQYSAKVILSGRSELSGKKAELFESLKRKGADITYIRADISNEKEVKSLFIQILKKHNRINGILHSAGVLKDSFLLKKTLPDFKQVLLPKIHGMLNLDKATQHENLDFFILFSSIAAVIGNIGQSDYTYANSVLDSYASVREALRAAQQRTGRTISINWPLWRSGGMTIKGQSETWLRKKYGLNLLRTDTGVDAFEQILNINASQVVVADGDKRIIDRLLGCSVTPSEFDEKAKNIEISDNEKLCKIVQEDLVQICTDLLKVKKEDLSPDVDFREYGVDSIMIINILNSVENLYGKVVPPNALIENPTIESLAAYLINEAIVEPVINNPKIEQPKLNRTDQSQLSPQTSRFIQYQGGRSRPFQVKVAVVSVCCRFPNSPTIEAFWENLIKEENLISEIPKDRWEISEYYNSDKQIENKTYSKWGGFIEKIDEFDASFFGVSKEDALMMDPQHRILLELVQELIDRAGYTKFDINNTKTCVYIGGAGSTYIQNNLDKIPEGHMKHFIVNRIPNMMAARISDFFNLKGESQTVDTACSSSLVAIHQACQSIVSGQNEYAIAGGIELLLDPMVHIGFSKAEVLSDDGVSYVFDKRANGFVLGEGAGLVLLKSYEKALADGDQILGTILGSAVNNDGQTMGVTVPNMEGQKEVISQVIKENKISPDTISYLEAHGTGTLLGDPIEIKAISEVYREFTDKTQFCAVGSVKSNMGHLLHAAGVASFIKVILSLQNRMLPATLHCDSPHPRFGFESSPFYPNTQTKEWTTDASSRVAAISSFGFGGTNCHMVIGEFDESRQNVHSLKRHPLPPTLFKRQRFWLGRQDESLNPADHNVSSDMFYSKTFRYNDQILRDHRIFSVQVLMGVVHCSLAIDAAVQNFGDHDLVQVNNIFFMDAIKFYPGDETQVAVNIQDAENAFHFENFYKKDGQLKTTASGNFVLAPRQNGKRPLNDKIDPQALIKNSREKQTVQGLYLDQDIQGRSLYPLQYGESLFSLQEVYFLENRVLGYIELSPKIDFSNNGYLIHPSIFDAGCINPLFAVSFDYLNNDPWVPFFIKRIKINGPVPNQCYCISEISKKTSEILIVNNDYYNLEGYHVLRVENLSLKRVPSKEAFGIDETVETGSVLPFDTHQTPKGKEPLIELEEPVSSQKSLPRLESKIEEYIKDKIRPELDEPNSQLPVNINFMEIGLDSNSLVAISPKIEKELGIELYPTLFFEYQNIEELTEYFAREHEQKFIDFFGAEAFETKAIENEPENLQKPMIAQPEKTSLCMASDETGELIRCSQSSIAPHVNQPTVSSISDTHSSIEDDHDIAVIGMAGRFADSNDVNTFWENLKSGKDLITEIPNNRWDYRPWFDEDRHTSNKTYSKWGSFIDNIDKFDAPFFRISPNQAKWMDPQLRHLYEIVHETFEDAGYINRISGTNTGFYLGVCFHEYWDEIVRANTPLVDYQHHSSAASALTGNISYTFDLQGASIPIDNACASSLTAIHMARNALLSGESDMAVVAGVNLLLSPLHYVYFSRLQALSPTGRCNTFDKSADGYVPGEGVAAMLLKPLNRAIKDRDNIHAVIKGSAINHVGKSNNPTSPRPKLQTKLLVKAWQDAGINPETITYFEAHGTGTEIGDPIEINALKNAFRMFTDKKQFCTIGSAKAHIGHLEAAAGISSVIKVILSMKNRQIPCMPNFNELNPYIKIKDSPLSINNKLMNWEKTDEVPRRAGVSAFGLTGNNAHVIVEEYSPTKGESAADKTKRKQDPLLFVLSAQRKNRLKSYAQKMLTFLNSFSKNNTGQHLVNSSEELDRLDLQDFVYTLQTGRKAMPERLAIKFSTIDELTKNLSKFLSNGYKDASIFQGNTKNNISEISQFFDDEDELLSSYYSEAKLSKLARLWVLGKEIDWKRLYENQTPRYISLPTYPFKKERHWIPRDNQEQTPLMESQSRSLDKPVLSPAIEPGAFALEIQSMIIETFCVILDVGKKDIDLNMLWSELGIDSVMAVSFISKINEKYNVEITPFIFHELPDHSLEDVCSHIASIILKSGSDSDGGDSTHDDVTYIVDETFRQFSELSNGKVKTYAQLMDNTSSNLNKGKYILGHGLNMEQVKEIQNRISLSAPSTPAKEPYLAEINELISLKCSPEEVGRSKESSVLLSNLMQITKNQFQASLILDKDCAFISDHITGTHIPGMVIVEAARQIAHVCINRYLTVSNKDEYRLNVTKFDCSFVSFVFPINVDVIFEISDESVDSSGKIIFKGETIIIQNSEKRFSANIEMTMFPVNMLTQVQDKKINQNYTWLKQQYGTSHFVFGDGFADLAQWDEQAMSLSDLSAGIQKGKMSPKCLYLGQGLGTDQVTKIKKEFGLDSDGAEIAIKENISKLANSLTNKKHKENVLITMPRQCPLGKYESYLVINDKCEAMIDPLSTKQVGTEIILEAARQMAGATFRVQYPQHAKDRVVLDGMKAEFNDFIFPFEVTMTLSFIESVDGAENKVKKHGIEIQVSQLEKECCRITVFATVYESAMLENYENNLAISACSLS